MRPTKYSWLILLLVVFSFVLAGLVFNRVETPLVTHWNLYGEPDGYSGKFVGLLLIPLINLLFYFLYWVLPRIDPKGISLEKSRDSYDQVILSIVGFLTYIYLLSVGWNLGWQFNMGQMIVPVMALLYWQLGESLPEMKPNWIMGIRTMWTLSNDGVWVKTHQLGGSLYKIAAVFTAIGLLVPDMAFLLAIGSILVVTVVLVVYSWLEYRKSR